MSTITGAFHFYNTVRYVALCAISLSTIPRYNGSTTTEARMADFSEMVVKERERLMGLLVDNDVKLKALTIAGVGIKKELAALDAYEAHLKGRAPTRPTSRIARSETLLATIKDSAGMTRAQLLDFYGAKGNKSEEGAISNALTNMKKKGLLTLAEGVYRTPT